LVQNSVYSTPQHVSFVRGAKLGVFNSSTYFFSCHALAPSVQMYQISVLRAAAPGGLVPRNLGIE